MKSIDELHPGLVFEKSALFEFIRARSAEVARRARSVAIDDRALEQLCRRLVAEDAAASPGPEASSDDPVQRRFYDDETTVAWVITLDAVNFGSGWFPVLAKCDGMSGYMTIASRLRAHFDESGRISPDELANFDCGAVARLFGQSERNVEAMELVDHFTRALRDLGSFVRDAYEGDFRQLVEAAGGNAARLVEILQRMPLYRDTSAYDELEIPFYKRAQITASDLAYAFDGRDWGYFEDLEELTLFADNLVPHVLRREGVLIYDEPLAGFVDSERRIVAGSPQEVEIRALALHAVEQMVEGLRALGQRDASARKLDGQLWSRGQRPEFKAHPRHRARSVYY